MIRTCRLVLALGLLLQLLGSTAFAQIDDSDLAFAAQLRRVPAAPRDAVVPGQIVVKLKPAAAADGAWLDAFAARGLGAIEDVRAVADEIGLKRLAVPPGDEAATAMALAADPRVEWAEPDYILHFNLVPNDRYYAKWQWFSRQIGTEAAWDVSTGASDVVVAVIDSGIDPDHPELKDRLVPGYNFMKEGADTHDTVGHGTSVAGLIGARGNNNIGVAGIAWNVRLMPLKVGDEEGAKSSDTARAVRWAADHGAKIINMSLGSVRRPKVLDDAVDYAWSKGAFLVAAVGNSYEEGNAAEYPAASAHVVAVGATTVDDARASYSNTGAHLKLMAPGGDAANSKDKDPNHWIFSTYYDPDDKSSGYAGGIGTSLAAPQVAGVAALLLSVNPDLTNAQIEQILIDTADRLGGPNRNDEFGYGRVNAGRALRAAARPKQVEINLDSPSAGATLSGKIKIEGWAADVASQVGGPGIDSISIYIDAPPPDGKLIGQAQLGAPRQDVVAQTKNAAFLNSGFSFTYDSASLPDGQHTLYIVVQPTRGEPVITSLQVTITNGRAPTVAATAGTPPSGPAPMPVVPDSARFSLDTPAAGATVSGPTLLTGWAVDLTATSGTGVLGVEVYLDAPKGEGTLLGQASYGVARPDVASALGNPAFANCGFQFTWNPAGLAPGGHRLYLYAQRVSGEPLALMVPITVGG